MHPILATTALSAAGDIVQNLASRFGKGPAKAAPAAAPAVPFVTLVDKASAPTAANLAMRTQDLGTRLGRSAEVAAAMNAAGASGPVSIQIDANGDSALRLPNGTLKPIQLSEEMRGVARELHQLRQPLATSATVERPASPVTVSIS
jgi:hypothetical protein